MTTIVVDQVMGYMASDFCVTSNDGEFTHKMRSKIEEVDIGGDRYLLGASGLEGPGLIFLDWFKSGDWDEPLEPMLGLEEADDFTVVGLSKGGLFVVDKFMRMVPWDNRWYGTGSGAAAAWAILEAGVGVVRAMQTALRLDGSSGFGFEVKYLDGTHEEYK
jgi:hypothetical protein